MELTNEKEFYKWFGDQFRALREQKGLKQNEVAKTAGLAPTDLSKFEKYGKKLSAYRVLRLLKAIDATMDDLIGDASKKNSLLLSPAIS